MNTNLQKRCLLVACTALSPLVLGGGHRAQACAELNTEDTRATITDEAAVIVWDAKTQTEHFIRRATFDASDSPKAMQNVGFLVPTPTMPQIAAVDPEIFDKLDAATAAQVQVHTTTGFKVGWMLASGRKVSTVFNAANVALNTSTGAASKRQSVQVEKSVRVGDYTATVLAARDTKSLTRWLKAHKYQTNDSLNDWLTPYIKQGWKITAFKIANTENDLSFDLSPVRLSFKTDKPYYPYREPASARAKGNYASSRALRIFFIGDRRVTGNIGPNAAKKWPGQTNWTAELPQGEQTLLKSNGIPRTALLGTRMTVFRDVSSPRAGTDEVFFKPAKDQTTVVLPPIIKEEDRRILIPFELILVGIIGVSLGGMKLANAIADKP